MSCCSASLLYLSCLSAASLQSVCLSEAVLHLQQNGKHERMANQAQKQTCPASMPPTTGYVRW